MKRIPLLWSFVLLLVFSSYSQKPIITCQDAVFNAFKGNSPNAVCEGKVILQAKATDSFSQFCTDSLLRWFVLIDLWGNGSLDLEYNSSLPETDTLLGNDTNGNGINDRYLPKTKSGETIFLPEFLLELNLLHHNVFWKTSNSCGEVNSCSSSFIVFDSIAPIAKGPAIDSIIEISLKIDSEVLAKSFDRESFDICSGNNLFFTFNNEHPVWNSINQEHYFRGNGILASEAQYNSGNAQKWIPSKSSSSLIPDCDMILCGNPFKHSISVYDIFYNKSTFEANAKYSNSNWVCESSIDVKINSINNKSVIKSLGYNFGDFEYRYYSNLYDNRLNIWNSYYCADSLCLTISKKDKTINGLGTKDMILLRNHILGIKSLESPYQLIAADVNSDGKINSTDLLLLRKLIFGLTTLDDNSTWIFFREDQIIDIENDIIQYHKLSNCMPQKMDIYSLKYTAVKRGDIDGSYSE